MKISDSGLKDIIKDAQSKIGYQHAINKEKLVAICRELLTLRKEMKNE